MEFNQLQIFCVAAKTLNFTKTGQALGYAQSNITGQIKQLEASMQVRLFERLGRKIKLTNEGAKFLPHAEAILQLCERAREEFSPNTFQGVLTIGAAETVCVHRLPKILAEYQKRCPQVEIRVHTGSCDAFLDLLNDNRIDLALMLTDKVSDPDMVVRTLCDENLVLVAGPLHPLAQKKKIRPGDLAAECLITTLPGCGYRPLVRAMLKEHDAAPKSFMELSSVGAIKECTSCGLGIAFLPSVSIQNELAAGKLVALDWAGPSIDVKTLLVYHREKWLTAAMRAFLALHPTD